MDHIRERIVLYHKYLSLLEINDNIVHIGTDNGVIMRKEFADFSKEPRFNETVNVYNEGYDAENCEDLNEINSSLLFDAVKHNSRITWIVPESYLFVLKGKYFYRHGCHVYGIPLNCG